MDEPGLEEFVFFFFWVGRSVPPLEGSCSLLPLAREGIERSAINHRFSLFSAPFWDGSMFLFLSPFFLFFCGRIVERGLHDDDGGVVMDFGDGVMLSLLPSSFFMQPLIVFSFFFFLLREEIMKWTALPLRRRGYFRYLNGQHFSFRVAMWAFLVFFFFFSSLLSLRPFFFLFAACCRFFSRVTITGTAILYFSAIASFFLVLRDCSIFLRV